MATQTVTLKVQPKGTRQTRNAARQVKQSWLSTAADLTLAFHGLTRVFGFFSRAIAVPIKIGAEQVRINAKINATLSQLTPNIEDAAKKLEDFALAQSLVTESSKGEVQSLQALSLGITRNIEGTNKLTTAAMAIASAFGTDAEQAVRNLSKTFSGTLGRLGMQIPALKKLTKAQLENGEAVEIVLDLYGVQLAAAVDTAVGRFNNLGTTITDLYLSPLGEVITDNRAFSEGLRVLADELAAIAPGFDAAKGPVVILTRYLLDFLGFLSQSIADIGQSISFVAGIGAKLAGFVAAPFLKVLEVIRGVQRSLGRFLDLPEELVQGIDAVMLTMQDLVKGPETLLKTAESAAGGIQKGFGTAARVIEKVNYTLKNYTEAAKKASAVKVKPDIPETPEADGLPHEEAMAARMLEIRETARQADFAAETATAELVHTMVWSRIQLQEEFAASSQERLADVANSVAANMGKTIGNLLAGTTSVRDALIDMAGSVAMATIDAAFKQAAARIAFNAAVAASGGAASQAGIPIVGPALAAGAAAAMSALVMGLLRKLKSYDIGGVVQTTGPALVHRNEIILNETQQKRILAGDVGGSSGGVTVNLYSPELATDKIQAQRYLNDNILPLIRDAWAHGHLEFLRS